MRWYHRLLDHLPFVTIEERSRIIDPDDVWRVMMESQKAHSRSMWLRARCRLHPSEPFKNGKMHYIGPPGVAVEVGWTIQLGARWTPVAPEVVRRWRDDLCAPDQNDIGRKAP